MSTTMNEYNILLIMSILVAFLLDIYHKPQVDNFVVIDDERIDGASNRRALLAGSKIFRQSPKWQDPSSTTLKAGVIGTSSVSHVAKHSM